MDSPAEVRQAALLLSQINQELDRKTAERKPGAETWGALIRREARFVPSRPIHGFRPFNPARRRPK